MNNSIYTFIAGLACLPCTWYFTASGIYSVSLILIILIASLGTWMAIRKTHEFDEHDPAWFLLITFVGGVTLGVLLFFAYFYFVQYGFNDPGISVVIAFTLIQGAVISVIGLIVVLISYYVQRRIE